MLHILGRLLLQGNWVFLPLPLYSSLLQTWALTRASCLRECKGCNQLIGPTNAMSWSFLFRYRTMAWRLSSLQASVLKLVQQNVAARTKKCIVSISSTGRQPDYYDKNRACLPCLESKWPLTGKKPRPTNRGRALCGIDLFLQWLLTILPFTAFHL